MTWWKALIGVALLLGVTGITVGGLKHRPPPAVEAEFAKAHKANITRVVSGAGKVNSVTTVKISSNLSGDLVKLPVKAASPVKRGQVLGQIDPIRFQAAAKQASAAQSAARADMQLSEVDLARTRVESLIKKGLASRSEFEKIKADRDSAIARVSSARERHAQAKAAHEEAENNLSKTTLVSPIDGTVIELTREIGERVRGSDFSEDVVMTLAALNTMEVKIEVSEHEVVYLREGQKADVSVDALEGQTFEGTVTEIARKALIKNPGTEQEVTSFPIKVALATAPPGVYPGMSAEVRVAAEKRDGAVVVPIQSVTVRAEKSLPDSPAPVEGARTTLSAKKSSDLLAKVVFVVDSEGRARARRVRTGIATDSDLEIMEGLQEGDKVVSGPYRLLSKDLKDGDWVKEKALGKDSLRPQGKG